MAVGWPEECLPGSASGERRGWGNITKLPSQFLKLGQWGLMWDTDQVSSQKAWLGRQRQQSERVFKHPGLQRPMGNAQKFLTSPPYPPCNNAGNLATIFSRLRRTVSLRTPPHPRRCCEGRGFALQISLKYTIPPFPSFSLVWSPAI